MKTYKHLIEKALSDEVIDEAFRVAIKRKRRRPEVARIIKNYDIVKQKLRQLLASGELKPLIHKSIEINDGFKLKKRTIIQPYFSATKPEQWIQHIIIQVLKPIFMRGMYEFSCGSVPARGVHYGKKYLEKYIRKNPDKIKYVLKADIYHFYENVNTDLLKARLKEIIKDDRFLKIVFFVLDSNIGIKKDGTTFRPGLPIGFYTSQWFANWFLQPLDHYIKEELKAGFYMRYMDDIVIFGSNKRELRKILKEIEKYLSGMDLRLKDNWQIYRFDYTDKNGNRHGRFIDFMGFKFYRDKTTIRKSIFLRACRLARRLFKKINISWYDACRMLSYLGWFCKTNTFGAFLKHVKPNIKINVCKNLISKKDRRIKQ